MFYVSCLFIFLVTPGVVIKVPNFYSHLFSIDLYTSILFNDFDCNSPNFSESFINCGWIWSSSSSFKRSWIICRV
jgi:hypothetical protein